MRNYSKLSPLYWPWDIKYYWKEHLKRMEIRWEKPVTYARFWDRLERWWKLYDAIYTPNCRPANICSSVKSKRNGFRKIVIDSISDVDTSKSLDDQLEMNRIQMPKPHHSWWRKLLQWFYKKRA